MHEQHYVHYLVETELYASAIEISIFDHEHATVVPD